MAQVVSHYTATVTGGATLYRYGKPDDTSTATRIYSGTQVKLPVDYAQRLTNQMYPLQSPTGWMFWYHLTGIAPVYTTVADVCAPPERLSIQNGVLTIVGGAGGDLNAWTGFGVSWRERRISESNWGEWDGDLVVTSRTVNVAAGSGMVRQYRVRTMGQAGMAYFSPYTVCDTLVNGNAAAGTPVVLRPLSGTVSAVASPVMCVDCPPEPDGEAMTLQRSLDGGEWVDAAALPASGGMVYDALELEAGQHTVRYRLVDANGVSGVEDGVVFTCERRAWAREISPGDIIANPEISFVADIRELEQRVNLICDFYGLNPVELPGSIGLLSDWHRQLTALRNAVGRCRAAVGLGEADFGSVASWPRAAEINQLRSYIDRT